MTGKRLLDLVEKGLEARRKYRERKHTERERQTVEAIEAELTDLLESLKGERHDARHES